MYVVFDDVSLLTDEVGEEGFAPPLIAEYQIACATEYF
jgi:hypothetical protein